MLDSQLESSVVPEVGCGESVPGQSWGGCLSFWGGRTAGRLMRGDLCQNDLKVDKRLRQPWITTGVAVGGSPWGQVYLTTIVSPLRLQPGRTAQHWKSACKTRRAKGGMQRTVEGFRDPGAHGCAASVWLERTPKERGSLEGKERRHPSTGDSVKIYSWALRDHSGQLQIKGKSTSMCSGLTINYQWNVAVDGLCLPPVLMLRAKLGHLAETSISILSFFPIRRPFPIF